VIWVVVRAVRRAAATNSSGTPALDVPERIEAALREITGRPRLASVLGMELSMLYYALAAWRRRPFTPAGTLAFSYHVQSSMAAIFGALALASVGELVAVHFLLRTTSPRAAWTLTIVSLLGVVWLVGFLRATILRPVLLTPTHLLVRTGLQWRMDIPLVAITRVEIGRVTTGATRSDGTFRAVRFGQPNVTLTLDREIQAIGAYGTGRRVSRVLLTLDDRRAFERALRERVNAAAFGASR
jgi:hypothetical protein